MFDILTRAGCFVAIIVIGYVLRKVGFFKEGDFGVLSKIVIKITLPAAIITSFSGKNIDVSMLSLALIGLGCGIIYMICGYLLHRTQGKEVQAFAVVNTSGYNIGNFTLPFVQSFLGPMGVITASLFDTGNACICLGSAYSIGAMIKDGNGFSFKRIIRPLSRSVPFCCYIMMITLNLLNISLPSPIVSCAEIIGNANAFLAMLMIGVGFKLSGDKEQIGSITKILVTRYALATVFALIAYFVLPFELEVRQALVILLFSPIASAAPAFTNDLKGDVGLSSAINSISIICSIVIILVLLIVML